MLLRFWRWLSDGGDISRRAARDQVPGGDVGGRAIFRIILILIPIATLVIIGYVNFFYSFTPPSTPGGSPTITSTPMAPGTIPAPTARTRSSASTSARPATLTSGQPVIAATPSSTPAPPILTPSATAAITAPIPGAAPTEPLGAFDPGLGDARRFLISLLIFIVAAIIETSLLLIYGAFYVNSPVNNAQALGLPNGTVRVFLLILVVLVILAFTLVPGGWGENKAVTFLFGALSTVVGFYYGSHRDDTAAAPPAVLTAMPNTLNFTAEISKAVDPAQQVIAVTGLPTNTRLTHSVDNASASWLTVLPPSPVDIGILYVQVRLYASPPSPSPGQTPAPKPGQTPSPSPGQAPPPDSGQSPPPSSAQAPAPNPGQTPSASPGQAASSSGGQTPTQSAGQASGRDQMLPLGTYVGTISLEPQGGGSIATTVHVIFEVIP